MSKDTFFQLNRRIIVVGVVVCLLLPFVHVGTVPVSPFHKMVLLWENMFPAEGNADYATSEININAVNNVNCYAGNTQPSTSKIYVSAHYVFIIVYFLGLAIFLTMIALLYRKIFVIIKSGRQIDFGEYKLVTVNKDIAPFSWWHYIVISDDDYRENSDEIIAHEKMHIVYRHSFDLVLMHAVLAVQWFNPAMWLLIRELKDIHEYQADKSVINQGIDAVKYQLLLVKKAVGFSSYTLANSFNHSKIKKRITMMLKEKSNRWNRLKPLLLIPASLLAVYVFANPELSRQSETIASQPVSGSKVIKNSQDGKSIKAKFHMLIMGNDGKILFDGEEYPSVQSFPDALEELVAVSDSDTINIVMQFDKNSLYNDLLSVSNFVQESRANHTDKKIVLSETEVIRDYSPDDLTLLGDIVLEIYYVNGKTKTFLIDESKLKADFKLDIESPDSVELVSVKADPNVSIGVIDRIKEELRRISLLRINYDIKE